MKALVFCDDLYHPAATVRAGLAPLAAAGWVFDWVEDAATWPTSALDSYSLALLSKSNVRSHSDKAPWLQGDTESVFHGYVMRGGGLVVIHSGAASYADVAPMRRVTGGTFVSHPPPCAVSVEPKTGHPLAAGVPGPFTVHDEHYLMALDDAQADVFLHTRSEHGVQPAGWTRLHGRGRVCVLTPGHFPAVWVHPMFQQLIANALRWVTTNAM
jgi:type 1 glutamine amidotransferase